MNEILFPPPPPNHLCRRKHPFLFVPFHTTLQYFQNLENIYFLCISLFQLATYPSIGLLPAYWSPTGAFTTLIPLTLCLFLEIVGDYVKWIRLYMDDYAINKRIYRCFTSNTSEEHTLPCEMIDVGMRVRFAKDDVFTMEVALETPSYVRVSMANLNGETYPVLVREGETVTRGAKLLSPSCIGRVVRVQQSIIATTAPTKDSTLSKSIRDFMMNTTIYLLIGLCCIVALYRKEYSVLSVVRSWIVLNGLIPFSIKILVSFIRNAQSRQLCDVTVLNSGLVDEFPFVDYVLTDKTGTLTQNKLELIKIGCFTSMNAENKYQIIDCDGDVSELMRPDIYDVVMSLSHTVQMYCDETNEYNYSTPEDKAIHHLCLNTLKEADASLACRDTREFTPTRPLSSNLFIHSPRNEHGGTTIYTKGATARIRELIVADERVVLDTLERMLTDCDPCLRILAVAKRTFKAIQPDKITDDMECYMRLVCLIGIRDRFMDGVEQAVRTLHEDYRKGVFMLTGDRRITAVSVARQIFKTPFNTYIYEISNDTIHYLETKERYRQHLRDRGFFVGYGLTPESKATVARVLRDTGMKTLAIGDGQNDIPMFQMATIGCSVDESVSTQSDFFLKRGFNQLVDCMKWGETFQYRNSVVSLYKLYTCVSIGISIFWLILLSSVRHGLFDLWFHQGFHVAWCIIHPIYYTLQGKHVSLPITTTHRVLRTTLCVAIFETSLLLLSLKPYYDQPYILAIIGFYLMLQVNDKLIVVDVLEKGFSKHTVKSCGIILLVNVILYCMYVHVFSVGLVEFHTALCATQHSLKYYYLWIAGYTSIVYSGVLFYKNVFRSILF